MKWFKQQSQIQVQEIPTAKFWYAVHHLCQAYLAEEFDRYWELPEQERSGHLYESLQVICQWLRTAREEDWWEGPDPEIN